MTGSTSEGVTSLAIDTATSHAVVAIGGAGGRPLAVRTWHAGHRHGDDLLPAIRAALGEAGVELAEVGAFVVGTGPGAFTGLRVGLATAKALAHAFGRPLVGVSSAEALLASANAATAGLDGDGRFRALLLPAGPHDRVLVEDVVARLLRGSGVSGDDAALPPTDVLVAVDLEGRAPHAATDRGITARDGLAATLLRLGAARLARGETDDVARLVPEYVTLPRGVGAVSGEVAWSRGRP